MFQLFEDVHDYGPHIYHTHDPEMKKFWLDNFGDLLVQKEFFANYRVYKIR